MNKKANCERYETKKELEMQNELYKNRLMMEASTKHLGIEFK